MPVNVKLLKKVRKLIAEEPLRLRMGYWGKRYSKTVARANKKTLPPCGTTHCLGGGILIAHARSAKNVNSLFHSNGGMRVMFGKENIIERAARLIGIPADDCPFDEVNWGVPQVLAWIDRQIDAASK